ncbi:MAG: hypothetical protein JW795_22235, partial [Chitinivibrionales bacterium]|nr:hypothetical protein [Chitinivibrionales bacterium]
NQINNTVGNNPKFTFKAEKLDNYRVRLIVTDSTCPFGDTAFAEVLVINPCPEAKVAPKTATITIGDSIIIDGSSSSDPDGEALIYQWSVTKPDGSVISNSPGNDSKFTLKPPVKGEYSVVLVVTDKSCPNGGEKKAATAKISVGPNTCKAPLADAGEDQTVPVGELVMLDGTGSKSETGGIISYNWVMLVKPKGSTAILKYPIFDSPVFKADVKGNFVIQLVVSENCNQTAVKDTDIVVVNAVNSTYPNIVSTQLKQDDTVCVNQKIVLHDCYDRSRILTTDSDGWVRFKNVPPGKFNLTVKDKKIEGLSQVEGTLMVNSKPVLLAQVKLIQKGKADIFVETDELGVYQLNAIEKGIIKIVISDVVPVLRVNPAFTDPGIQNLFEKPVFFEEAK